MTSERPRVLGSGLVLYPGVLEILCGGRLNGGLADLRPPAELGEPQASKPERRSRKNSLDLCGDGLEALVSFVRAGIGAPPPAIDRAPTPAIRAAA